MKLEKMPRAPVVRGVRSCHTFGFARVSRKGMAVPQYGNPLSLVRIDLRTCCGRESVIEGGRKRCQPPITSQGVGGKELRIRGGLLALRFSRKPLKRRLALPIGSRDKKRQNCRIFVPSHTSL